MKVVTFRCYKICHEHELSGNPLLAAYLIQLLSSQLVTKMNYCLVVFYPLAIIHLINFNSVVVLSIVTNNTTGNFPQKFGNHHYFYASLSLQIGRLKFNVWLKFIPRSKSADISSKIQFG